MILVISILFLYLNVAQFLCAAVIHLLYYCHHFNTLTLAHHLISNRLCFKLDCLFRVHLLNWPTRHQQQVKTKEANTITKQHFLLYSFYFFSFYSFCHLQIHTYIHAYICNAIVVVSFIWKILEELEIGFKKWSYMCVSMYICVLFVVLLTIKAVILINSFCTRNTKYSYS